MPLKLGVCGGCLCLPLLHRGLFHNGHETWSLQANPVHVVGHSAAQQEEAETLHTLTQSSPSCQTLGCLAAFLKALGPLEKRGL